MKHRRHARELALQALYYMDMRRNTSIEAIEIFRRCFTIEEASREFFTDLVMGVSRHRPQIDDCIERFSENWRIDRMACVDRNIMRIAVFEMAFVEDIPPKVSINEAIEIGKRFGTEESGAFINGILDGIHNALQRGELRPDPSALLDIPTAMPPETIVREPVEDVPKPPVVPAVRVRPGVMKRRAPATRPVSAPVEAGVDDPASDDDAEDSAANPTQ